MESGKRHITDDLIFMKENPGEWTFYRAVRELECISPDNPRTGYSRMPDEEAHKIIQLPSLSFKGCDIEKYYPEKNKLAANCFGLLGTNGPMPLFFSEYIYKRCRQNNDYAMFDFLTIFQNRLLSLFYRAWAVFEPVVSCDREHDNYILTTFKNLIGCNSFGNNLVEEKRVIADHSEVFYSGFLMSKVKSMSALKALLRSYFGVSVDIEQFSGRWIKLFTEYKCILGNRGNSGELGKNISVGSRVWERRNSFRVKLGPMELYKYMKLLPGTEGFKHLVSWIRKFIPPNLEFDIYLSIKKEDIRKSRAKVFLGYTSWVYSEDITEDREDLIISSETIREKV